MWNRAKLRAIQTCSLHNYTGTQPCPLCSRPTAPESWPVRKARLEAEAIDHHDDSTGTCLDCDLPIRLHPPGRQIQSRLVYCFAAFRRSLALMASDPYEGLYCSMCGAKSGNTDLCVLCAVKYLNNEQQRRGGESDG